jgi:hypothetical protein
VDDRFRVAAERLMGTTAILVDSTSAMMDRLRLIQGVFIAHRGRDLWLANTNDADVAELQVVVPRDLALRCSTPGIERAGEILRLPRLPAGRLIALSLDRAPCFTSPRAIALDASARARASFQFGEVCVNAGDEPWEIRDRVTLARGECRALRAAGVEAPRPFSVPDPSELYRLLAGQLGIIGREILFRGRSLDSGKFLGSDAIRLEDHSSW